jgi:uncharacterized protein (TIGR02569 family)
VQPPDEVLSAFGASAEPVPLTGGEGRSWLAGGVVLKPVEDVVEAAWVADVLADLDEEGFRVARPVRARHGGWTAGGWAAFEQVAGEHRSDRWGEVLVAGDAFHARLADVPAPAFLEARTNAWAVGDRVAWGEEPGFRSKHLDRLLPALRQLELPRQVVHGDLTGNVLFADRLAPAVIDFAPYFRPVGFAAAIVVADALVWKGADETILRHVQHVEHFPQLLLRALVYRVVTDRIVRAAQPERPDDEDPYLPAVELARAL